jgi:hypothetical protein
MRQSAPGRSAGARPLGLVQSTAAVGPHPAQAEQQAAAAPETLLEAEPLEAGREEGHSSDARHGCQARAHSPSADRHRNSRAAVPGARNHHPDRLEGRGLGVHSLAAAVPVLHRAAAADARAPLEDRRKVRRHSLRVREPADTPDNPAHVDSFGVDSFAADSPVAPDNTAPSPDPLPRRTIVPPLHPLCGNSSPIPLTAQAVSPLNAIHHEQGTFKTIGMKNNQAVDALRIRKWLHSQPLTG